MNMSFLYDPEKAYQSRSINTIKINHNPKDRSVTLLNTHNCFSYIHFLYPRSLRFRPKILTE